jgi:hypothetical protein
VTAVITGVGVVSAFDRRDAGPRWGALVLDTGADGGVGAVALAREATEVARRCDATAVITRVGVVSAFDRRDAGPHRGVVLDTGADGGVGAVVLAREGWEQ